MAHPLDIVLLPDGTRCPESERLFKLRVAEAARVHATCGHAGCELVDDGKTVELGCEIIESANRNVIPAYVEQVDDGPPICRSMASRDGQSARRR